MEVNLLFNFFYMKKYTYNARNKTDKTKFKDLIYIFLFMTNILLMYTATNTA